MRAWTQRLDKEIAPPAQQEFVHYELLAALRRRASSI
jgi:hypothetical protein